MIKFSLGADPELFMKDASGAFISAIINFLIFAFVIFLVVRWVNKTLKAKAADAGPTEVDLLTEIRDSLKK